MGRKLSYCKDDALVKATHLFNARGYEKTCMREIAREIDVPVASLYHTFGDKNALLVASLESYFENNVKPQMHALAASSHPLSAIQGFFEQLITRCTATPNVARTGCMMLHVASDLGEEVPEAAKAAKHMMGYLRDQFTTAIVRGQAMGQITTTQPVEFLSAHVMANIIAVKTWLRMGANTDQLKQYIEQALAILKS